MEGLSDPANHVGGAASKLALRAVGLAASVAIALVLIVWIVPDGNDYAQATHDKHNRLEGLTGPRLVLIGGSNLAYGIDSELLEQVSGYRATNMALSAFLGLHYIFAEVRGSLRSGDVVLASFEHETFVDSSVQDLINGDPESQFAVVKARPASWQYVGGWDRRARVLSVLPRVASKKLMRVLGAAAGSRAIDREEELLAEVESRSSFNAYGDLTRHLDRGWPEPLPRPTLSAAGMVADDAIQTLAAFVRECRARGIRVVVIPPPTPESYYASLGLLIEHIYQRLRQIEGAEVLPPKDYVYPDGEFFDVGSHLGTTRARRERSERVLRALHKRGVSGHPQMAQPGAD